MATAIEKLRKDIEIELSYWDEVSMFTLAGVDNLSRSDLAVLHMYCDSYLEGDTSLMPLCGACGKVWSAYVQRIQ